MLFVLRSDKETKARRAREMEQSYGSRSAGGSRASTAQEQSQLQHTSYSRSREDPRCNPRCLPQAAPLWPTSRSARPAPSPNFPLLSRRHAKMSRLVERTAIGRRCVALITGTIRPSGTIPWLRHTLLSRLELRRGKGVRNLGSGKRCVMAHKSCSAFFPSTAKRKV